MISCSKTMTQQQQQNSIFKICQFIVWLSFLFVNQQKVELTCIIRHFDSIQLGTMATTTNRRQLTSPGYSRIAGPFHWFLFTVIGISVLLDRTSAAGNWLLTKRHPCACHYRIYTVVHVFDLVERKKQMSLHIASSLYISPSSNPSTYSTNLQYTRVTYVCNQTKSLLYWCTTWSTA